MKTLLKTAWTIFKLPESIILRQSCQHYSVKSKIKVGINKKLKVYNTLKAEIIATGTELLLGEVTDTNTSYLAQQLASLGIDIYYTSSVGDNYERLLGALQCAWDRSDIILTTGGLGPTQGDLTREAIAGLFNEKMAVDPTLKSSMEKFFSERHIEMTTNNLKQAMLIPSARAIPNPRGTAPGWWAEKEGKVIIAMPGPPGEMHGSTPPVYRPPGSSRSPTG